MRVLLIDPTIPGTHSRRGCRWTPLGLAYLGAALQGAGHQVRLHNRLNMQAWHGMSLAEVDRATECVMRRFAPQMIGIGGVTASFPDAHALAEMGRRACPNALIVLGGPHATTVPQEALERIPAADCLVIGEGEQRIVQLAGGAPPDTLAGTAWRDGHGRVHLNQWTPPDWTLDSLPAPARELLDMPGQIRHSRGAVRGCYLRCTSLLSSRRCVHRCAYCSEPAYSIRGYRQHSPEYTVSEAKGILRRYRVPMLTFLDENFTCDRQRVVRLAELWRSEG